VAVIATQVKYFLSHDNKV